MIAVGLSILGMGEDCEVASQELAQDQVVVFGIPMGDINTIDPMGGFGIQSRPIFHHIWGSLVRYPIGDASSLDFEPDLATKWEVSPDKLTWTFHLRKGVKWQGGYGEFTSEDVVHSLGRVKNSKVSSYRSHYEHFKEVSAIDKFTVQITTARPDPFLLVKLANYYGGFIVCKKAIERAGAFDRLISLTKEEAIGTGPFKFEEYRPKDRIVLTRNDDYWEGKPIIEKLVFRYIPDAGARELALLKGEIAVTLGAYDGKWLDYIKSKGIIVEPWGPADVKALWFNLKMKPFDDRRIREAFAYGMSSEQIYEMQGKNISEYCTSPVPTRMYGHIDAGWGKYKRDPEKAKKLLAEAGYPNGLTVKLFMSSSIYFYPKMVVYQNELKECGINLEMTQVDDTIYWGKVREGICPIGMYGGKYPTAHYWLRLFYHSDSRLGAPKAAYNWMGYSNPEVDKLIELAETTFDKKAQLDSLAKAQTLIVQDLPAIPSIEVYAPTVRNPWFDLGYKPVANFLFISEVGLKTKILKH
jgi:peptide/nickel transport system substrate-binding protein